jgi:hypothetical protein
MHFTPPPTLGNSLAKDNITSDPLSVMRVESVDPSLSVQSSLPLLRDPSVLPVPVHTMALPDLPFASNSEISKEQFPTLVHEATVLPK